MTPQDFPRMMYHRAKGTQVVQSAVHEAALGSEWKRTRALAAAVDLAVIVVPAVIGAIKRVKAAVKKAHR